LGVPYLCLCGTLAHSRTFATQSYMSKIDKISIAITREQHAKINKQRKPKR